MICDDQKEELEQIEKFVLEYKKENPGLFLEIKSFSEPLDMLAKMEESGVPDIALLDICMPGTLGTEIAQKIKEKSGDGAEVIFLTTSREFAVEAFALHASDYLTKPYSKERLAEALDRVVRKRRHLYVSVRCENELRRIDLYSVIYVEARNHQMEIHTNQGSSLKTRMTLTELKEQFQNVGGFLSVGASFIVNLRCVQGMSASSLKMSDGGSIPVPRRRRAEVKKQYFDFYAGEVARQ